jgi:eukaryotic-like serine/threonine-protein kinase
MDAEQRRRAEEDAGIIDSIALEALGPRAVLPAHPGASFHGASVELSPHEARPRSSNEDLEAASESVAADGERIDEYCDKRRLDVFARLKLFSQVCEAVHLAHQHAVICRDLKPGNILVTSEGVPKLSDLGIGKLVGGGSDNDALVPVTLTRTGELALTPEYASPEQVMGETITTASDIYALGVILYELLTGRSPYHLKTGTVSELLQAICEQVPEKPSTSVIRPQDNRTISSGRLPATQAPQSQPSPDSPPLTANTAPYSITDEIAVARGSSPEGLKRILSGDLEMIVLMAMRKEPERRYVSADQFADDLKLYLKGLPVRAHPDSATYRTIKFMRRRAAVVITGGVFVFAFVAGVVGITAGLIMAHRERDRALESSRRAREAVNQFVTQVTKERLLNQPGLYPLRRTLLEDARHFYEDFLSSRSGDGSLQADRASARTHVAQISSVTGSTTEALKQFEQAVTLWDNLVATHPASSVYREALARALNEQGRLMMMLQGRRDEAFHIFRRAQDLIEPLVADSGSATAEHELVIILQNIAEIEHERGHPIEAIENIQRLLEIESKRAAEEAGALDPIIAMAKGHALLGQILVAQPEGAEPALTEYQQAVELLETVHREHPELSDQALELALLLGDLSTIQQMAGKLDSALASAGKAAEILERLERQYPGVLNYEQGLASSYNRISELHGRRREPAEAIAFAHKAQTLLEKLIRQHLDNADLRIDLAKSQNTLGRLLQETGEPVAALRSFQRAVDLYESIPELDQRNCYNLACNVALSIPLIGMKNGTAKSVDISKLSKGDQLRRKRYGDRAVEALRTAAKAEFLDLDILRSDTDLDPIRDRPDFQSLMDEVEKKAGERNN